MLLVTFVSASCGDSTGPNAAASSVVINPGTAVLLANDTQQFSATVLDQNGQAISAAVQWTSSASSVATVSGTGLVTALTPGTATIQASSGSVQAQVTVTVRPPFSIQLSSTLDSAVFIGLYECRFSITASATGGRLGTQVEWTTSTQEWLFLDGTTRLNTLTLSDMFLIFGSSTIITDSSRMGVFRTTDSKPYDLRFELAYTTDGFDRFEEVVSVDCF